MAVIIQNVDPKPDNEESTYEVRINLEYKATFNHKRQDGLAECLRAAADAVEEAERDVYGNSRIRFHDAEFEIVKGKIIEEVERTVYPFPPDDNLEL